MGDFSVFLSGGNAAHCRTTRNRKRAHQAVCFKLKSSTVDSDRVSGAERGDFFTFLSGGDVKHRRATRNEKGPRGEIAETRCKRWVFPK